jgi:uncharacterized membrane protein YfcA
VLGALTFRYFSDGWVRLVLGAISVGFVLHYYGFGVGARASPASPAKGLFWSTVSGLTSTIAHAGGPPLSIYLLPLRLDKAILVGTTVVFFAVVNAVKVVPYAWLGLFDARNLSTSAALAPLAPVGIFLGYQMMRRVNERLFYRICYALLLVVGMRLLWEGFTALRGVE